MPAELKGATAVAGDALDRESLIRATEGVDIIFNGLNPIYTDWGKVLPMAENVMAACRANGALHLAPGKVYNYGSPSRQGSGKTRRSIRQRKRAASGRHGRTFPPGGRGRPCPHHPAPRRRLLRRTGTGSWFDLVVASKIDKGVYTAAGPADIVHEWAYLPDFARPSSSWRETWTSSALTKR